MYFAFVYIFILSSVIFLKLTTFLFTFYFQTLEIHKNSTLSFQNYCSQINYYKNQRTGIKIFGENTHINLNKNVGNSNDDQQPKRDHNLGMILLLKHIVLKYYDRKKVSISRISFQQIRKICCFKNKLKTSRTILF